MDGGRSFVTLALPLLLLLLLRGQNSGQLFSLVRGEEGLKGSGRVPCGSCLGFSLSDSLLWSPVERETSKERGKRRRMEWKYSEKRENLLFRKSFSIILALGITPSTSTSTSTSEEKKIRRRKKDRGKKKGR